MKMRLYNLLAIIAGAGWSAFAVLWLLLTGDERPAWIAPAFVATLIAITGMKEMAEAY